MPLYWRGKNHDGHVLRSVVALSQGELARKVEFQLLLICLSLLGGQDLHTFGHLIRSRFSHVEKLAFSMNIPRTPAHGAPSKLHLHSIESGAYRCVWADLRGKVSGVPTS